MEKGKTQIKALYWLYLNKIAVIGRILEQGQSEANAGDLNERERD